MLPTQQMLDAHPLDIGPDRRTLVTAVEALEACANACTQCADACLAEPDIASLARCIRLDLDCADVCMATSRVIARQTANDPGLIRPLLEACIAACVSCADECERHAEAMEHCRICAEQCRACEDACQQLLTAMG